MKASQWIRECSLGSAVGELLELIVQLLPCQPQVRVEQESSGRGSELLKALSQKNDSNQEKIHLTMGFKMSFGVSPVREGCKSCSPLP